MQHDVISIRQLENRVASLFKLAAEKTRRQLRNQHRKWRRRMRMRSSVATERTQLGDAVFVSLADRL